MFDSFKIIWRHRKMLWATTISDIRSRYAGAVLGMFWLVLYPVLMLTAYSIVYVFILQIRLEQISTPQYVLLIFSGLIPFLGFSEGLANGVVSVTANASLVKNTLYPIEIIPVKAVLFSQCTEVVGVILLTIALAVFGMLSQWALLVVPLWIFQVMFGIGMAKLGSSHSARGLSPEWGFRRRRGVRLCILRRCVLLEPNRPIPLENYIPFSHIVFRTTGI